MKTPEECAGYEGCDAPLCPLDEGVDYAVFYPDEDVCMAREFTKLHWVRIQKRIKKYKVKVDAGYFTKEMLNSIRSVSKSIKGIDPDGRASLDVWLSRRKPQDIAQNPRISQKGVYPSFEEKPYPPKGYKETKVKQLVLI